MKKLGTTAAVILGTGFGVGFSPIMPGTVGSLWGLPLIWALRQDAVPDWGYVAVGLTLALAGIPTCGAAARALGRKDPPAVVFDEIAAFPFVFAAVPFDATTAVAGFVWFRLFDIVKPWPIRRLERLPGGFGVMADDLLAGVYAGVALWGTWKLLAMAWLAGALSTGSWWSCV